MPACTGIRSALVFPLPEGRPRVNTRNHALTMEVCEVISGSLLSLSVAGDCAYARLRQRPPLRVVAWLKGTTGNGARVGGSVV